MMFALEVLTMAGGQERFRLTPLAPLTKRYAPFAVLLATYLGLEYVVNSRSYLITEGHYQLGWHAVPHAIDYLVTLGTGTHNVVTRTVAVAVVAALLAFGTARIRFFVVWMLVTIAPSMFFTWENASRYLYLPAAGFAMLLADVLLALKRAMSSRLSPRIASIVAVLLTLEIAASFADSASNGPRNFRELTRPYSRFVAAVRRAHPVAAASATVVVDRENAFGIQRLYLDPAAEVATCGTDLHVVIR
jgi:hypothetical protein